MYLNVYIGTSHSNSSSSSNLGTNGSGFGTNGSSIVGVKVDTENKGNVPIKTESKYEAPHVLEEDDFEG
jgi:hypothetical protein